MNIIFEKDYLRELYQTAKTTDKKQKKIKSLLQYAI